ncbi:MAG: PKD domain-containing protein [Bacteroidetes bacterium]|nr:PKD domain-containing protein [Bacteroidota bacterium]
MATINSSTPIALNTVAIDVTCYGANNGSALVSPQGGTPPYTFAWTPSGGNAASAANLAGGAYSILVTDANGCASIDNITIDEPDQVILSTSPAVGMCIGQSALLEATVTGGTQPYSYQWSNGATTATQSVTPASPTTYTVSVTDANGCSGGNQAVTVNLNPPLSIVANEPINICEGSDANLSALAQGGDGNYTYSWSNGITGSNQTVTPTGTTNYTVTVNDGCGSPAADASVVISVNPAPQAAFGPYVAHGCAPVTVNFIDQSTAPAGSTYAWQFGDSGTSDSQNPSHTYTEPGIYTVDLAVTAPGGCGDSQTSINLVEVYANPTASFTSTPEEVTLMDNTVYFNNSSTNGEYYEWNFGDGSPAFSGISPSHEYSDTGYYNVMLITTSINGCVDTTFGIVRVIEDFTIFIPNAFTPNADHANDDFNAYGIGWRDYNLYILDRWGLNIYHSSDPAHPWDGTYESNGKPCQADVYVYKYRFTIHKENCIHLLVTCLWLDKVRTYKLLTS